MCPLHSNKAGSNEVTHLQKKHSKMASKEVPKRRETIIIAGVKTILFRTGGSRAKTWRVQKGKPKQTRGRNLSKK